MKQAGVVAVVGLIEKLLQTAVNIRAVAKRAQAAVVFNAPVFSDAQEDNAVDGALDGIVEFSNTQRVAQGDVAGKRVAPAFDFGKKSVIHFGRAALGLAGFGIFIERAFENDILGKDGGNFVPLVGVLAPGVVSDPGFVGFIFLIRLDAAVVNGEFFKVGHDGKRQFGRPGVTSYLKGGGGRVLEVDGWFLGFDKEFALSADAKGIVGRFGDAADFDGVFVDDILVGFGMSCRIVDIPAQCFKEGIDEFAANLRFVIPVGFIGFNVAFESFN